MKRFLALGGAITMVAVAIVVRAAIDDDEDQSGSSSGGRRTIACVTELTAYCNTLTNVDVRIEEAAVTLKAITDHTSTIDGWVTFDPWPQMAGLQAQPTRIAASRLTIAMAIDRSDALATTCAIGWRCVGDATGRPWTEVGGRAEWGQFKVGVPTPTSALGALVLGNAASGYFGRTDFATNDFDGDFIVWKSRLTATPGTFVQFLQQFPAAFSAVGALGLEADRSTTARPVRVVDPNPPATAVVVIVDVNGRVSSIRDALGSRLRDDGWGQPPDDAGLPNPGVLLALSGLTG